MDNLGLIRKIAWSFHKSTGLDWDDLFQEAALAYLECLQRYDPTRGKITTYMWQVITCRLLNYIKNEAKYSQPLSSMEDRIREVDTPVEFSSLLDHLSLEAREITRIILKEQERYIQNTPEEARKEIAKTLRRQGWSWKRIWCGIQDLKLAFTEN